MAKLSPLVNLKEEELSSHTHRFVSIWQVVGGNWHYLELTNIIYICIIYIVINVRGVELNIILVIMI